MSQDLLFEYFCKPIIDQSMQGYNFVNTGTYAAVLLAAVVFFLYPFLKRMNLRFEYRLMLSLIPFVVFGSSLRVLNDMGIFRKTCSPLDPMFYTFTPGIWVLTAAITVTALWLAKKSGTNEEAFHKNLAVSGVIMAAPIVLFEALHFKAWGGFALTIGMAALIVLMAKAVMEAWKKGFFSDSLNLLVVSGQALDGSATFVATHVFRCGEQHPLSAAILGINPVLFVLVKVALAIVIVHVLDREIEDENTRQFLKVAVAILGFAPGIRDLLTLSVGTCL